MPRVHHGTRRRLTGQCQCRGPSVQCLRAREKGLQTNNRNPMPTPRPECSTPAALHTEPPPTRPTPMNVRKAQRPCHSRSTSVQHPKGPSPITEPARPRPAAPTRARKAHEPEYQLSLQTPGPECSTPAGTHTEPAPPHPHPTKDPKGSEILPHPSPERSTLPGPPPPRVREPDSPTNRLAAAKTPGCSKPAHERASVPMRSVRLLICTTTQPSRAKGGSAPGQVHTPKRRRALGAVGDAVTKRGRLAMWFSVGTAGCSGQPWLILPGFCWGAVAKRAPLRCGGAHRLKGWLAHSRVLEGLAQALPPVKQRPNYTSSDSPAGTLAAAKTGPCRDIRGQQREGIRQGACVRLGRPSAGRSRRPGQQTTGERGG